MAFFYCDIYGWGCCEVAMCRDRRKYDKTCKACKQFLREVKKERDGPKKRKVMRRGKKFKLEIKNVEVAKNLDPNKFWCSSWEMYVSKSFCESGRMFQHPSCDGCKKNRKLKKRSKQKRKLKRRIKR